MELSSLGPLQGSVFIRMGLVDDEKCFVVLKYHANGQPDGCSSIARVPNKEWAAMKTYDQLPERNNTERNETNRNMTDRNMTDRNKTKKHNKNKRNKTKKHNQNKRNKAKKYNKNKRSKI